VSLIAISVEKFIKFHLPFSHQVLSLTNSADSPLETPLSHLEDRTILTTTDEVEGQGKDLG
jgi:hypothetical protein